MARVALKGAKEAGADEVQLINLNALTIKPCIDCKACVRRLNDPDFDGGCPLNDDMDWLDEQYLSRLYAFALLQFVEHHRAKFPSLAEGSFQAGVTLQMQFAWGEPYIGNLLIAAVATVAQFVGNVGKSLTGHYGLACTGRGFKNYLMPFTAQV